MFVARLFYIGYDFILELLGRSHSTAYTYTHAMLPNVSQAIVETSYSGRKSCQRCSMESPYVSLSELAEYCVVFMLIHIT